MRREYAGAARKARLAASLGGSALDLGILGDDLTGWPTGAGGPFFVVIGRGTPSEEKILCESRTGNSLTVYTDGLLNGRGADGTTIVSHAFNDYLEHVHTATDADEANEHVNSTANVHGVTSDLVGENDTQTLTNKSIDGNANTLTNIPQAAVTGLVADIDAIEAVNATQTTNITNVTNANIATQAEVDALEIVVATKAPINNPTFTGTVTLPSTTSIGNVTGSEIANLDGTVTNLQTQIDAITGGGVAVPPGGTTGMVLVKRSNADYDMEWQSINDLLGVAGGPGGSGDEIVPSTSWPTGGDTIGTYTDAYTGRQYRYHKFVYGSGFTWPLSPKSLVCPNPGFIGTLLMCAGGAGIQGYIGSGLFRYTGGGGGVYYGPYAFGTGIHNLVAGRGGYDGYGGTLVNGQTDPNDGQNSYFDDVIVYGGGKGALQTIANARNGGSGGGGNTTNLPGLGLKGTGAPAEYLYGADGNTSGAGGRSGVIVDMDGAGGVEYGGLPGSGFGAPAGGQTGFTGGASGENGIIIVKYRIA